MEDDDDFVGNEKILSGEELVRCAVRRDVVMPSDNAKESDPTGSWLEAKHIESRLRTLHDLIAEPRVNQRSQLSEGTWNAEKGKAEIVKPCGKHWETMGHLDENRLWLHPEEALFLLEANHLDLSYDGVGMSLEQAYQVVLGDQTSCSIDEYRTYAYMTKLGYKVVRHQGDLGVTSYERQLNLDQYGTKKKGGKAKNAPGGGSFVVPSQTSSQEIVGSEDEMDRDAKFLTGHQVEEGEPGPSWLGELVEKAIVDQTVVMSESSRAECLKDKSSKASEQSREKSSHEKSAEKHREESEEITLEEQEVTTVTIEESPKKTPEKSQETALEESQDTAHVESLDKTLKESQELTDILPEKTLEERKDSPEVVDLDDEMEDDVPEKVPTEDDQQKAVSSKENAVDLTAEEDLTDKQSGQASESVLPAKAGEEHCDRKSVSAPADTSISSSTSEHRMDDKPAPEMSEPSVVSSASTEGERPSVISTSQKRKRVCSFIMKIPGNDKNEDSEPASKKSRVSEVPTVAATKGELESDEEPAKEKMDESESDKFNETASSQNSYEEIVRRSEVDSGAMKKQGIIEVINLDSDDDESEDGRGGRLLCNLGTVAEQVVEPCSSADRTEEDVTVEDVTEENEEEKYEEYDGEEEEEEEEEEKVHENGDSKNVSRVEDHNEDEESDDDIEIVPPSEVERDKALSLIPNCVGRSRITIQVAASEFLPHRAWPKRRVYSMQCAITPRDDKDEPICEETATPKAEEASKNRPQAAVTPTLRKASAATSGGQLYGFHSDFSDTKPVTEAETASSPSTSARVQTPQPTGGVVGFEISTTPTVPQPLGDSRSRGLYPNTENCSLIPFAWFDKLDMTDKKTRAALQRRCAPVPKKKKKTPPPKPGQCLPGGPELFISQVQTAPKDDQPAFAAVEPRPRGWEGYSLGPRFPRQTRGRWSQGLRGKGNNLKEFVSSLYGYKRYRSLVPNYQREKAREQVLNIAEEQNVEEDDDEVMIIEVEDEGSPSYESTPPETVSPVKEEPPLKQEPSSLKKGPVGSLWSGETVPLIQPCQARSTSDICSHLDIIANTSKRLAVFVQETRKFKISFDVYNPKVHFRKSAPRLPNYRIVVTNHVTDVPAFEDVAQVHLGLKDGVPLLFAVVSSSTISFYCLSNVKLPLDITLG